MTDIEKAKSLLKSDITCVAVKKDTQYISKKTGISPILDWIIEGVNLDGFSLADKIIGKAAAMLIVKAKIKTVYTHTISFEGNEYLKKHNVAVSYNELIPHIINRTKTDICPMEKTVKDIDDCVLGFKMLTDKRNELNFLKKQ